jgi:cytochrome bd ubiquinol oxidase subunit I
MNSALAIHRLHFAFTATFHHIFPQLTMGLALLIVVLKIFALVRKDDSFEDAALPFTTQPPLSMACP